MLKTPPRSRRHFSVCLKPLPVAAGTFFCSLRTPPRGRRHFLVCFRPFPAAASPVNTDDPIRNHNSMFRCICVYIALSGCTTKGPHNKLHRSSPGDENRALFETKECPSQKYITNVVVWTPPFHQMWSGLVRPRSRVFLMTFGLPMWLLSRSLLMRQ